MYSDGTLSPSDHVMLPEEKAEPVPDRGSMRLGGAVIYLIRLSAPGPRPEAALCLLSHPQVFTQERLQQMVDEAAAIVQNSRIATRRRHLAAQQVPLPDPHASNHEYFQADVEFFEAVMMDKFQFQRIIPAQAETKIEPTILL